MNRQADHHIVVLGGGYAGVFAAVRAARKGKHLGARVTLVNPRHTFVERIRLHQVAAGQEVKARPITSLLRGTGVTFVEGAATRLDPDQRTVAITSATGERTLGFDTLVFALGSTPDLASVPGAHLHAHALGGTAAARVIAAELPPIAARGGRLMVVGGGLTGIEAATELAGAFPGLRVNMVTAEAPGPGLSAKGQHYLRERFARAGITIHERMRVEQVEAGALRIAGGQSLPFDLCLWAASFVAPPLARDAGLEVNGAGQLLVDPWLRSRTHPWIIGAGDAAHPVAGPAAPLRMACATAMPMAAHAADVLCAALAGKEPAPFRFGYLIQCISLGRGDGLVQYVEYDDRPRERVHTGRMAAMIKEAICRSTMWSLRLERLHAGTYRWPHGRALPETAPSTGPAQEVS